MDEYLFKPFFSPVKEGILGRLSRLCASIPSDATLGFHLCYGDFLYKHFVEPENLAILVDLANNIIGKIGRRVHSVEWIHMLIPKDRTDAAYFEPLKSLKLDGSHLYLGVVNANDDAGTKQRIRAAQSVFKQMFGVATEYGIGRTSKEELGSILEILKSVTDPGSLKRQTKAPTLLFDNEFSLSAMLGGGGIYQLRTCIVELPLS